MNFRQNQNKFPHNNSNGLSTIQTIAVGIFVALLLIPVFSSLMDISRSAKEKAHSNSDKNIIAAQSTPTAATEAQPMTEEQKAGIIYDKGQKKCYDPPITPECGANTVSLHQNKSRR